MTLLGHRSSKNIISKTTKTYHPRAGQSASSKNLHTYQYWGYKRGWKAKDYLCIIVHWKYALSRRLVNNFGFLFIKIVKLAFHVLDMDFCLRVSATMIALAKNHPRSVLFWLLNCQEPIMALVVCLFHFFLKLKRKIFEMMHWWYWKFVHSFILYLISDFRHYPSQTISPCSYPTPQLPLDCNFSTGFRWQRRGGVATLKEKKTHEKRNIAFTLLRPIFKKAFFLAMGWPEKEKNPYFFVMFNQ